ncbi:MAG: PP2C family protein-serine/threonine phosphatase [Vicinamibacterales bacterium]
MNERRDNQSEHGRSTHDRRSTGSRSAHDELRAAREQLANYRDTLVTIQRAMLPQRLPDVPGLELAVHFADADGVGGDFYDVRPVASGHWAIVIADVIGHGLGAAAILAVVHALGNAVDRERVLAEPGAALALVNGPLTTRYLADTGKFVTAFVGLYDAEARVLTYASAGHPPPRLVRGNTVRRLDDVSGLPLGLDRTSAYEQGRLELRPGDRLVLFTDGVTESMNSARSLFGDERLDAILPAPVNSAAELLNRVTSSVSAFREGRPAGDDETCLIVLVRPTEAITQREGEVVRC